MKLRRFDLLLLLLGLPRLGYSLDIEGTLRDLSLILLAGLAGLAVVAWSLIATVKLIRQLGQPEAADPAQRRAVGRRITGLTLPATAVAWVLPAWLTYDPHGNGYYPAAPLTLLVGLAVCLLLRWQRRLTAARAMLRGLLVAGALTALACWLQLSAAKPSVPELLPVAKSVTPLGLLDNPVFQEAVFSTDSVTATADTSHVYEYVEQMPGFRGGSAGLKAFVNYHLRYPEAARRQGLMGIVQVSFVVQPNGRLTTAHIDAPLSAECDQEALRILYLLDRRFSPGLQNGRPVPVQEILVFGFGPPAPLNQ